MRAAVTLCPHIAIERHKRRRAELAGAGELPPGTRGDKPPSWVLGITRSYQILRVGAPTHTVYLPAPFRTVHTYTYGADGRINPVPATRHG